MRRSARSEPLLVIQTPFCKIKNSPLITRKWVDSSALWYKFKSQYMPTFLFWIKFENGISNIRVRVRIVKHQKVWINLFLPQNTWRPLPRRSHRFYYLPYGTRSYGVAEKSDARKSCALVFAAIWKKNLIQTEIYRIYVGVSRLYSYAFRLQFFHVRLPRGIYKENIN